MRSSGKVFSCIYGADMPVIERGKGIYIYDENGKEYIDSCAGIAVNSLGHGRTDMADAMRDQAAIIAYCAPNHFENNVSKKLAEKLATVSLGDLNNFFFTSGGSENNESIMKLAREYFLAEGKSQKHLFISRQLSYHGATLGTVSLCGVKERREKYEPMLLPFPQIPPAYCYRCPFGGSYPSCNVQCARALEDAIIKAGPENVAGFFAEPVVNTTGCLVPPKEYFKIIADICRKYDVLFIADEVITGFGRLGRWFGLEHWEGVTPDIMSCAKGVSGGYAPLGVCMISDKIALRFEEKKILPAHLITFTSNPMSARAGLKTFEIFEKEKIIENAAIVGEFMHKEAQKLFENPMVGDVRGLGLTLGVEIVQDRKNKKAFPAEKEVSKKISRAAMEEGFLVYAGRITFNGEPVEFFQMFPPLIITKDQVSVLLDKVDRTIKKVQEEWHAE